MAGVSFNKGEKEYLDRIKPFRDRFITDHLDSPMEGFEYFESDEYRSKFGGSKNLLIERLKAGGPKNAFGMVKIFRKHMPNMMKGRSECFTDLNPYLDEIELNGQLSKENNRWLKTYPNSSLWEDLKSFAYNSYGIRMGFTELPNQLVFKGKTVLFRHAIVCIQEMDKSEIDKAPRLEAGSEVMRVYKELGLAVNEIARWLRDKGIRCQSNHPLGGLTDTTPLAAKAGLGWQGSNGLLITPWFGQRQRIAPIFIEEKIFEYTDNYDHKWIESFCSKCKKCIRSCPANAIYEEKKVSVKNVPGIGETRTCIDRTKCFPQFNATMGCSICVKVCPFSQGAGSYDKLKKITVS